jgi:hypothetical protein
MQHFEQSQHHVQNVSDNEKKQAPESVRLSLQTEMAHLLDMRSATLDHDISLAMIERGLTKGPAPNMERFRYGNLDIQFVGVHHVAEALPEYRKVIDEAIAQADFVVSEVSIETSGAALDARAIHARPLQVAGDGAYAAMFYPSDGIGGLSARTFFYEIENMVKKHGKQIVFFDPYSDQRFLQTVTQEEGKFSQQAGALHRRNLEIREYSKDAAMVGSDIAKAAVGAGVLEGIYRSVIDRVADEQDEAKTEISRRHFLKRGVAYVAGAALGTAIEQKADENIQAIDLHNPSSQRVWQYNLNDFRDIAVAHGIDRLNEHVTKSMKVAIIYGDYHRNGVRYYLEQPEQLRDIKAALYGVYSEIAPPEMTAYRYEMNPDIVSGKGTFQDTPEQYWGQWKETIRAKLPT